MERCSWCLCNEKMIKYHDEEWGVPLYDDRKQFEEARKLISKGFAEYFRICHTAGDIGAKAVHFQSKH